MKLRAAPDLSEVSPLGWGERCLGLRLEGFPLRDTASLGGS